MIEVEYISYLSGGVVKKFYPKTKLLLPIKFASHRSEASLPGEWKIKQATKPSPYKKYRLKEKKKMTSAKCRCVACNSLVDKWIDDKCVQCYNAGVSRPYMLELRVAYDGLEQYRTRKLVRLGNWFTKMFVRPIQRAYFLTFVSFFGLFNEVKKLVSSPKKECKCSGCPDKDCK